MSDGSEFRMDGDLGHPDIIRMLLSETRAMRKSIEEVRTVLMVSTPDRGCVIDNQRKHAAQIADLEKQMGDHEEMHRRAPSAPTGFDRIFDGFIEGLSRMLGQGAVILAAWGSYHLIVRGSP